MWDLREIKFDLDWEVLLNWRNDKSTRISFFDDKKVTKKDHKKYIKNIIKDPNIKQYILVIGNDKIGTIKSTKTKKDNFELSYTISPLHRGKKLSIFLMKAFLYRKKGTFICKIKSDNIPSQKMVEACGYKLYQTENNVKIYKLEQ
jgi:RimJ/RimL family protein N-acetyltransferase